MNARIALILVGALALADSARAAEPAKQTAITISRETTYITEPLDAEGYPDYLAALNAIASEGVTPENNAAVDLAKILGPGEIPVDQREQFFKLLGMEPLLAEGKYLVSLDEFLKRRGIKNTEATAERLAAHRFLSWTDADHQLLNEWLETNAALADLCLSGSRKTRFFSPFVRSSHYPWWLADDPFPRIYHVVDLLLVSAAMRATRGEWDAAFSDLDAAHRWARLRAQSPSCQALVVGVLADLRATRLERIVAMMPDLPKRYIVARREFVFSLPPMTTDFQRQTLVERFDLLNAIVHCSRFGLIEALKFSDPQARVARTPAKELLFFMVGKTLDWDRCLAYANEHHEELILALEREKFASRLDELGSLRQVLRAAPPEPDEATSNRWFGRGLYSVTERYARLLADAAGPLFEPDARALDRFAVEHDLLRVVYALAAFRHDHGEFPLSLEQLVPVYLERVPKDQYSNEDFRYSAIKGGFALYSTGQNGRDDKGRGYTDVPRGDDLTVHSLETERRALQQAD